MRSDALLTIAGKRGYGKTTAAKSIIKGLSRVVIWDRMKEYDHPNSYIPVTGSMQEFNNFLKGYWEQGNIFIFVDEADQVMPEGKPLPFYANQIINLGRHRNIGMGAITRRIARLNKDVFAGSQEAILFNHHLPNDIKYLKEVIPNAQNLATLQKYQYRVYPL